MEFKDTIKKRQSCRKFDPRRQASSEDVAYCLDAAMLAPSACNSQPMHYYVCQGQTGRQVAALTQSMGMNGFTSDVSCFIVISEEPYNLTAAAGSRVKHQDFKSVDIGISTAHLTLAAADRGLSTCILGWFDEKKLRELLGKNKRIRLVVALGYASAEEVLRPKIRKDPVNMVDYL